MKAVSNRNKPVSDQAPFLFVYFPSQRRPLAIKLSDHGSIAWVKKFRIEIVAYEIEKGRDLRKADPLGVGFVAFGETVRNVRICSGVTWSPGTSPNYLKLRAMMVR